MTDQSKNKNSGNLDIRNACLLDNAGLFNLEIRDGSIRSLQPTNDKQKNDSTGTVEDYVCESIDADGGLVTQSYVDPHFHLDKVLSREYFGAVSPEDAFAYAREVKKNFVVENVFTRACRALELAVAQGIGRMRTHVDVDFATKLISLEGILQARQRFQNLIDVEIVAFPQEGIVTDPQAPMLLREALSMGADLLGGLPEFERSINDQKKHINVIFDLAEEHDVAVDMHCDYMDQPELKTLEMIADIAVAREFQQKITASHCNALATYPDDEAERVIEKIARLEFDVTVLPVANLQMLGGAGRTPVCRGSSRIKELLDAGVNVAAGADNMFDIWFRFNRMDPIEVGYITCLSGAMRTNDEVREAFNMVTTRGAKIMGVWDQGVQVGAPADLVIHQAANLPDVFRNLPGRRLHIKAGTIVGGVEGQTWIAPS